MGTLKNNQMENDNMDWETYIKESERTTGTFESKRMAIAYWTLGIVNFFKHRR